MKNKVIITSLLISSLAFGQIHVQNTPTNTIGNQNPFLDASGFNSFGNNIGKGLYFPTTNLKTWEFKTNGIDPGNFSTYFDGMIVFNTGEGEPISDVSKGGIRKNLKRGFYYFNNPDQIAPNGSVEHGEWVRLGDNSTSAIWANDTANTLVKIKKLSNGTTDRSDLQNLSIKDDGKVLLGRGMNLQNDAVLSSSKLQVEGALSSLGVNSVGGGSIGSSLNLYNTSKTEDNQAYKWTIYNMTGLDSDPDRGNKPSGYKNGLVFWAYNKNNTNNETNRPQMMLTDNGNLIIGGSIYRSTGKDFEEKLYVDGDAKITGLRGQGNRPVYADDNGKLIIGNATATSKWNLVPNSTAISLAVNSAGKERVSTGEDRNDVAIEDTGIILAKGFKGYNGASIFPDYVFEDYYNGSSTIKSNYKFANLSQVESFIKEKGHLPGYASAKEIQKQGYIDIISTQLTNVEKIEELYLHSIEQEKAIQAQLKELDKKEAKIKDLETRLNKLESLLRPSL